MSWLITPQQPIPAVIGEPFGGGYFAGYISHTADGNPTHALIVAPRADWCDWHRLHADHKPRSGRPPTPLPPAPTSSFDGAANTAAMVTAGIADHPAANFASISALEALPTGICQRGMSWTSPTSTSSLVRRLIIQAGAATFIQCHGETLTIRLLTQHKLRSLLLTPLQRRLLLMTTGRHRRAMPPSVGPSTSATASRATAPRRTAHRVRAFRRIAL